MAGACGPGKIWGLRGLAQGHESEFVYALRSGGFTVEDACQNPEEAYAYVEVVARDPASPLHASLHGWDYPLSREGMLILDLLDLTGRANAGKKWKSLPRPWPKNRGERFGTTALPRDEAIAILAANAGR